MSHHFLYIFAIVVSRGECVCVCDRILRLEAAEAQRANVTRIRTERNIGVSTQRRMHARTRTGATGSVGIKPYCTITLSLAFKIKRRIEFHCIYY